MVVGAGRGPLVRASLQVCYIALAYLSDSVFQIFLIPVISSTCSCVRLLKKLAAG